MDIKTYMIIFLSLLAILNIPHIGVGAATQTIVVVTVALFLDGFINWIRERKFRFSKSACISGLIIAELLSPHQSWLIYIASPSIAILSKHLIKIQNRHIFNPAGFGVFVSMILFSAGLSWWANSPLFLIIAFGLFIVYKMKRWHLILSFLLINFLLLFFYGIIKNISFKESIYLINTYFVFFMLTEPKTQPQTKKAQVVYGCLIGIFSFIFLQSLSKIDYSISALLIGNLTVPILNKWFK